MRGLEALKEVRQAPSFMGGNDRYRLYLGSDILFNQDCDVIKKELQTLEIIKQLCEVYETPKNNYRYLKVGGVVVYTIKSQEEYALLKEVLENEQWNQKKSINC